MHQSEYAKYITDYNREMRRTITTDQLDDVAYRMDEAKRYIRLTPWVIAIAFGAGLALGSFLTLVLL